MGGLVDGWMGVWVGWVPAAWQEMVQPQPSLHQGFRVTGRDTQTGAAMALGTLRQAGAGQAQSLLGRPVVAALCWAGVVGPGLAGFNTDRMAPGACALLGAA